MAIEGYTREDYRCDLDGDCCMYDLIPSDPDFFGEIIHMINVAGKIMERDKLRDSLTKKLED